MLHARVVRPPAIGAKLEAVDDASVGSIAGVVKVVREGSFLGVVAETEWAAIKAAGELKATWFDERAAALEQVAARGNEILAHGYLPDAMSAARLTALTMRACVPHRHRFPASAFLMSASLGLRFPVRKAAASMIMPLMQ